MDSQLISELSYLPALEKTKVKTQAEDIQLYSFAINSSNPKNILEYRVGKQLGRGNYGKVFLGLHNQTGEKIAIKIIPREVINDQNKGKDNAVREIEIMRMLNHPNVLKLLEVYENEEAMCMLLEYVRGGELLDRIIDNKKLSEDKAARYFRQIVDAVAYCHQRKVVHRDLKAENILVDAEDNIKLIDFGLSNIMQPGKLFTSFCGSPLYEAPEILLQSQYNGPEVDIWSVGVLLFAMVTGFYPWGGESMEEQLKKASVGAFIVPDFVSPECRNLIERLLNPNPSQRATMQEVKEHPWLKGTSPEVKSDESEAVDDTHLDQGILAKLAKMGFSRKEVIEDMKSKQTLKGAYIMYQMLVEKKEASDSTKELSFHPEKQRSTPETESTKRSKILSIFSSIGRRKSTPEVFARERRKTVEVMTIQYFQEEELKQLRVSKAVHNSETTSVKQLDIIKDEIEAALRLLSISFQVNKKGTIYTCQDINNLALFEIEVVRLAKLEGTKAIEFKKKKGDEFEFSMLKQRILNLTHL